MNLTIDWKLYNPLYWHIKEALYDPDIRYIFVYGGSSSGKTYSVGQNLVENTMEMHHNNLCMRKYSVDVDDTIYADMSEWGSKLNKYTGNVRAMKRKIEIDEAKLQFRGMDKSERIQGISKYQNAYKDEITHFNFDDFKQMRKRLRGRPNQKIIGSWNPININHWINKRVLSLEEWEDLPTVIDGLPYS